MGIILETITEPINVIILAALLIVFIGIMVSRSGFGRILDDIKRKKDNPEYRRTFNRSEKAMESVRRDTVKFNAMDKPREEFDESCARYSAWVQMITLFPLLGLLGTIIGMIPGLQEMAGSGNVDSLYSCLSVALTSTFYGLIASIFLKFITSCFVDTLVDKIDAIFVEYDRQLNIVATFRGDCEEITR